jgi:hypothetical protein
MKYEPQKLYHYDGVSRYYYYNKIYKLTFKTHHHQPNAPTAEAQYKEYMCVI